MLDLDRQLREYGAYLDDLGPEPRVIAARHRSRSRLVAAAIAVALVGGSIAVVASHGDGRRVTTIGAGAHDPTTSTSPSDSAIEHEHPTFALQVAQLEAWYENWPAEAPGGRPLLAAEAVFCAHPSIGPNVQIGFASYFPLGESLTETRIVDGCRSDDPAVAPVETPAGALPAHQLCATQRRGPNYDPSATVTEPVTRPAVVFGNTTCEAAGYETFPSGLLDELNTRRHIEIEMRAVPRACPTQTQAAEWAAKVTGERLARAWPVTTPDAIHPVGVPTTASPAGTSDTTADCFRPGTIDWDLQRVSLDSFAPVPNVPLP